MKEGLRSGKLRVEKEKQLGVEKKGDEVKQGGSDLGGEKNPHLVSGGPEESEREFSGDRGKENDELGSEECVGDGDTGEGKNVVAAEIGNESFIENAHGIGDDGVEKKKVKGKEVEGKVQIVGRVLRSQSVVNGGRDKPESDGALVVKSGARDGSPKQCSEVKNAGVDQLGESENVGVCEIGKKRRRVGNGQGLDDDGGLEKKKVKEEEECGKVPSAVKVLRSRVVMNGGCDKAARDGSLVRKSRGIDGSRKRCTAVKNEEGDQLVTKKLKGKRGRPPKVKKEESDRSVGGLNKKLKRKRGRPKKVEKEESDLLVGRGRKKLKIEHGRSLEVRETNVALKGKLGKEGKMGLKSQERRKANTTNNGSYLETRIIEKELDATFSPAKGDQNGKELETEDSEDGEGKEERKLKGNKKQKNEHKDQDGELARSRQKQLVRDKMVDLIMRAGWTIQYRPRYGREYKDAVYVSPAGNTHWSITKAYKNLKNHCENGDGKSGVCMAGFKFTPIPPEEVDILTRIIVKKRVGKKKVKQTGKDGKEGKINENKKGKGGSTADGVIEEKKKKKLGKSLKGKYLLLEQDDSATTACKGRRSLVQGQAQHKTKNRKRCALLVRNSENADSENDGYRPYDGKRTVLAWMVDLGTLSLNSKLKYMNRRKTQVLLEGRVTRDGIHCDCCRETISISKFVTHAGIGDSEPFKHVYLDSGSSLLQCLLDSWNKQDEYERRGFHFVDVNREDPNDDTCGICGDGGDLICCDGCPSTFHQSCLEIKKFPSGEWHCVYCSCKFCGMFAGNACQRDGNENVAALALITCQLCEEKYHQSCIQSKDAVNDDSSGPSFCGKNCQELFEGLQMLIGVRHEMEEGFSLTLLRRSDIGSNVSLCDTPQENCDSKLIECNSKLAVAFLIMDECFLPMVDHRSGVNLIHNILYNRGSNFSRLNYSGFFTAILERGDEIISAATVRIHGNYLAEMPFIGTRYMYRRQGMCRRLLTALESALCSLNVERLVIPAISELRETWTSVFGFKPLEKSSKQKMKNMNMLVFPGVDILQKPLFKHLTDANMTPVEGLRTAELERQQIGQEVLCDTNEKRLAGSGSEATAPCGIEANDELGATEPNTQGLCVVSPTEPNTQGLCVVSQDNLEGKSNTIMITGLACDVHEQTEMVNEYQSSASVPEVMELDTQMNQHIMPEVGSKSFTFHHIDSEATDSGIKILSASKEGTENIDCEVRMEDDTVKNPNSHDEGTICHSTENNATDMQNMALVHEVKVSGENIVCRDSETTTQTSHDTKDLEHHNSQHLQVTGSTFCPDGKMFETCDPATQHTPTVMAEVHPECIECGSSKILTETSQVTSDVFHPCSLLAHQKANDSEGHCTTFPVGCSISGSSGNGLDTHKIASPPADIDSHLQSIEITKSPEVTNLDLTSNGFPMNTESPKQSEFDSQAGNTSVAQCSSSNASVGALHCASGGGNSGGSGTSKVMIVSNRAS